MKRKRVLRAVLAALVGLLLLAGLLAWRLVPGYASALRLNWGISLPILARPSLCYEADSGPSFHGDGERYHVLQYAVGSGIESALFWQAPPVDADETEATEALMDHLDVPDRLRPDLESCRWHTATDPSDSRNHLYLLFDPSTLELYILESFF